MAQSLEELSSIYSEASELGLTALGITQPHILGNTSIAVLTAASQIEDAVGDSNQVSMETNPEDQPNNMLAGSGGVAAEAQKKKRANYSYIPLDVKKKVVAYALQHGTKPAGRLFNISEGTIRSWKMKTFDKESPVRNRGRKVTYGKELDEELYQHLMAMKKESRGVTIDQFSEYAKKRIDETRPELNFKCSRGWVDKFFKRHNLRACKSDNDKQMNMSRLSLSKSYDFDTGSFQVGGVSPGDANGFETSNDFESSSSDFGKGETQFNNVNSETLSGSAFIIYHRNEDDQESSNKRRKTESGDEEDEEEEEEEDSNLGITPSDLEGRTSDGKTTLEEIDTQSQLVHTQHILSVMGRLDAKSFKKPKRHFAPQQKLKIVEHAKMNGSRSAERTFGVPETTVRSWVKKLTSKNQEMEASLRPEEGGLVASDGHHTSSSTVSETILTRGGEVEANILAVALSRRLKGEAVTFDELCDQALSFVSQEKPGKAYSSTRKWVGQFLELKVKDILNVTD